MSAWAWCVCVCVCVYACVCVHVQYSNVFHIEDAHSINLNVTPLSFFLPPTQLSLICQDPAAYGDTVWTSTHRFFAFFNGVLLSSHLNQRSATTGLSSFLTPGQCPSPQQTASYQHNQLRSSVEGTLHWLQFRSWLLECCQSLVSTLFCLCL